MLSSVFFFVLCITILVFEQMQILFRIFMFFCDPELSCTIMIGGLIEKLRRVAFAICNCIGIRYSYRYLARALRHDICTNQHFENDIVSNANSMLRIRIVCWREIIE